MTIYIIKNNRVVAEEMGCVANLAQFERDLDSVYDEWFDNYEDAEYMRKIYYEDECNDISI